MLCQDLMQSIHNLSNSQLLQNISQGSSSELKDVQPLSPSKKDYYNSNNQSKTHSRMPSHPSNITQNSMLNYKSVTSVHSKSPSINSISPKKRKGNKENQENQENDEPLIVSARNFMIVETLGDEPEMSMND